MDLHVPHQRESLPLTFETPKRFGGAFTLLVESLCDAVMVLQKESWMKPKVVSIEEIRAAIRHAKLRKCC